MVQETSIPSRHIRTVGSTNRIQLIDGLPNLNIIISIINLIFLQLKYGGPNINITILIIIQLIVGLPKLNILIVQLIDGLPNLKIIIIIIIQP